MRNEPDSVMRQHSSFANGAQPPHAFEHGLHGKAVSHKSRCRVGSPWGARAVLHSMIGGILPDAIADSSYAVSGHLNQRSNPQSTIANAPKPMQPRVKFRQKRESRRPDEKLSVLGYLDSNQEQEMAPRPVVPRRLSGKKPRSSAVFMTSGYRLIPAKLVTSRGFFVTNLVTSEQAHAHCRQDS